MCSFIRAFASDAVVVFARRTASDCDMLDTTVAGVSGRSATATAAAFFAVSSAAERTGSTRSCTPIVPSSCCTA